MVATLCPQLVLFVTATAAVTLQQCPNTENGVQYLKPDHYKQVKSLNIEDCCDACAAEGAKCGSWKFNEAESECRLLPAAPTDQENCSSWVSGRAIPPAPTPPTPPSPPQWQQHPGILNITAPPFSVDASGKTDVTKQLQAAINAAYQAQVAVFLPPGRYLISDTLEAAQDNYGSEMPFNVRPARWRPNLILGSTAALPQRPTLVLKANAHGFGDPKKPKNVFKLTNTGRENDNMNQVFRGVDFEIGPGNGGAIALFMHAAQGGAVQDVTVRMTDAFAGFGGGGGAGASHVNVAAYGGRYGVFFAASEPAPLVAGGVFVNQTVSGLMLDAKAQGPLIATGVRVRLAPNATGPAISSTWTAGGKNSVGAIVVDAEVDCSGTAAEAASSAVYLRNVWARGCNRPPTASLPVPPPPTLSSRTSRDDNAAWTVFHEAVRGQVWSDGVCAVNAGIDNVTVAAEGEAPPANLVTRHVGWNESIFPSFERGPSRGGAADAVRDCGAKGDGVADDAATLQRCLDLHGSVFLPKGVYRLSRTLVLPAHAKLVGLSQTHSVLAPTADFAASPASPQPLVRTASALPVTLAFVGLVTHWHVDGAYTLEWNAAGGLWRSNYETRVCECMWLSDYGSPNTAHGAAAPHAWPPAEHDCRPGVVLDIPKTQIRGTGRFYNFVNDEDILMTGRTGYRHLLVANISATAGAGGTDRLTFYSLNLEHAQSEAAGEIRNASRVDIYGFKKEGSTVALWIRDSTDVNLFAGRDSYTALQNASQYPAGFANYTPSLFRIERTSPLKLVGVGGDDGCGASSLGPDQKCKGVVPCHNFPTSDADLITGHFPEADWPNLLRSLWQPWCGYRYPGAIQLVEADGIGQEHVATTTPGAVYMRGYATNK